MGVVVDVRTVNPADVEITDIFFDANDKLVGSSRVPVIQHVTSGGPPRVLCSKNAVDDLIKALELAKRVWGIT